ncbi:MAG TPA: hypothetical protein EYF98_15135 [Planctomycetes bacterium]|nr:hypothetical protein [Planctomycetota bacterium]
MKIIIEESTDGETRLAYALFMDALDDLRSSKKALEGRIGCTLAEDLLDGTLLRDFDNEELASAVRGFSKTLETYREARRYFMDGASAAVYHAGVVGLDGSAAVSRVRLECSLPFNSRLAADAATEFMAHRQRYANKSK